MCLAISGVQTSSERHFNFFRVGGLGCFLCGLIWFGFGDVDFCVVFFFFFSLLGEKLPLSSEQLLFVFLVSKHA